MARRVAMLGEPLGLSGFGAPESGNSSSIFAADLGSSGILPIELPMISKRALEVGVGRNEPGRGGLIFLLLFGGVFAALGIGFGTAELPKALAEGDREQVVLALIFSSIFTCVGLGIMGLGVFGRRRATEQAGLEDRYPQEPWMWKKEWAEGRITGDGRSGAVGLWAFRRKQLTF